MLANSQSKNRRLHSRPLSCGLVGLGPAAGCTGYTATLPGESNHPTLLSATWYKSTLCSVVQCMCCKILVGLVRLHFTTCLSWEQDWTSSLAAVHLHHPVPLRREIITLITLLPLHPLLPVIQFCNSTIHLSLIPPKK